MTAGSTVKQQSGAKSGVLLQPVLLYLKDKVVEKQILECQWLLKNSREVSSFNDRISNGKVIRKLRKLHRTKVV